MVAQLYVDDSGTGRNGPVFLLAAYEAPAAKWAAFTDEWRDALRQPPSIEYFKASECFSRRGEFYGLSAEACGNKAAILAEIIKKHVDHGHVFAVTHDDFDSVFLGQIDGRYDNPYYLTAIDLCEQTLAAFINQRGRSKVEIIFDYSDGVSQLVTNHYTAVRDASIGTETEYIFKEVMPILPMFADEKCSYPLQAADMLAWFMRRVMGEPVITQEAGAAFDVIIKEIPLDVLMIETPFLEQQKENILKAIPDGYVYFHQLAKDRLVFDKKLSDHNRNTLRNGGDYPTLNSLSTKQMRRRLLLRNCTALDRPHLHTLDGRCLAEASEGSPADRQS